MGIYCNLVVVISVSSTILGSDGDRDCERDSTRSHRIASRFMLVPDQCFPLDINIVVSNRNQNKINTK